ncbi:MAG: ANTAR domain-containing protein [Actinomycetota bacterium]|nr:ANTAR domain-containing protein [Actinomycetota bacterium]
MGAAAVYASDRAATQVIERAKGILIKRYELTADQSWQALTRAARYTDTKVRDISNTLVRTGGFPQGQVHRPIGSGDESLTAAGDGVPGLQAVCA